MQTTYGIRNFRVFDETGETLSISPVTIITGRNSSGKSSIVKSVLLLNSFLKKVKADYTDGKRIELKNYTLDFREYPNNTLGRYDRVVNNNHKSRFITFSYTVYSRLICQEIVVKLQFLNHFDVLNNGFLVGFEISTPNGIVIYSSPEQGRTYCNINFLQPLFVECAIMQILWENRIGLESAYEIDGSVSEEEYEEQREQMRKVASLFSKKLQQDTLQYIKSATNYDSDNTVHDGLQREWLSWSFENHSLYYIPLVDYLSRLDKESAVSYLENLIDTNEKDSYTKFAIRKIIEDFSASSCKTFLEYQVELEKCYFADDENRREGVMFSPARENGPYTTYAISLPQDYIFQLQNADAKRTSLQFDGDIIKKTEKSEPLYNRASLENQPVDFAMFYEVIMLLNESYENGICGCFEKHDNFYNFTGPEYSHKVAKAFGKYVAKLVEESLTPDWVGSTSYVSSSRVSVKRMYSLDDTSDFSLILRKYFESRRQFLVKYHMELDRRSIDSPKYDVDLFMTKWLRKFGVGENIKIDMDEEGLGVTIHLIKKNGKSTLLADEGYGMTQLLSILLQIETAILSGKDKVNRRYIGFNDVFSYEASTIAIEEPEIHLHPQFQSMLADMFMDAYQNYNVHFIVETHSEYLIRRLQCMVGNNEIDQKIGRADIALLYVNNADPDSRPEGEPHIKKISIQKDGYLSSEFGKGFFDEASRLSRELL